MKPGKEPHAVREPRDIQACYSLYINNTVFMLMILIFIFQGKNKTLEKVVNRELKKLITGLVLTNHVSIVPKAISCSKTVIT